MPRRSTQPRILDDRSFPVRLLVRNGPGDTLALRFTEARAWLNDNVGRGEWAMHGQSAIGLHAAGFYFRSLDAAARFFEAHPHLELVDTTGQLQHVIAARKANGRQEPLHSTPGGSGGLGG